VLKVLWLKVRWSSLDDSARDGSIDDFRTILNYTLPLP
jgi:hypothetical protein